MTPDPRLVKMCSYFCFHSSEITAYQVVLYKNISIF